MSMSPQEEVAREATPFIYTNEDVSGMKREHVEGKITDFWSLPSYMDAEWFVDVLDGNIMYFCHKNKIWQILNVEFIDRLSAFLKHFHKMEGKRPIVEICAGNGKTSYHLRKSGVDIIATDDYSMEMRRDTSMVKRADFLDAIDSYLPEIVLLSWPDPNNEHVSLEALNHPAVRYLIKIDNIDAGGDIYNNSEHMELRRPTRYGLCIFDHNTFHSYSHVEIFAKPDIGIRL